MNKNLRLIKLAILLNTLSLTGYIAYNELSKQNPQSDKVIEHACQIVGTDSTKNIVVLNCIENVKN